MRNIHLYMCLEYICIYYYFSCISVPLRTILSNSCSTGSLCSFIELIFDNVFVCGRGGWFCGRCVQVLGTSMFLIYDKQASSFASIVIHMYHLTKYFLLNMVSWQLMYIFVNKINIVFIFFCVNS